MQEQLNFAGVTNSSIQQFSTNIQCFHTNLTGNNMIALNIVLWCQEPIYNTNGATFGCIASVRFIQRWGNTWWAVREMHMSEPQEVAKTIWSRLASVAASDSVSCDSDSAHSASCRLSTLATLRFLIFVTPLSLCCSRAKYSSWMVHLLLLLLISISILSILLYYTIYTSILYTKGNMCMFHGRWHVVEGWLWDESWPSMELAFFGKG